MKTFILPCFGIVVVVDEKDRTGSILSKINKGSPFSHPSVDAIESLILSHACAGVNIEDPAYIAGIERAVNELWANYSS